MHFCNFLLYHLYPCIWSAAVAGIGRLNCCLRGHRAVQFRRAEVGQMGRNAGHAWRVRMQEQIGQGMVEYSLLLSMLVIVVIAVLSLVGRQLADGLYYSIYRALPWAS